MARPQTVIQLDGARPGGDAAAIDAGILGSCGRYPSGELDVTARTTTEASIREEPW